MTSKEFDKLKIWFKDNNDTKKPLSGYIVFSNSVYNHLKKPSDYTTENYLKYKDINISFTNFSIIEDDYICFNDYYSKAKQKIHRKYIKTIRI